jgi:hypothetical protein
MMDGSKEMSLLMSYAHGRGLKASIEATRLL